MSGECTYGYYLFDVAISLYEVQIEINRVYKSGSYLKYWQAYLQNIKYNVA
jgi:hypothetical protein